MSKRIKQMEVAALAECLDGVENCVVLGYRGLSAAAAVELRRRLRAKNARLTVFKNALARRAMESAKLGDLSRFLDKETALVISDDPLAGPRALEAWCKQNPGIVLRGGLVEGTIVDAAGIKALAAIPSREALLSRLLTGLATPATSFARALGALQRKVAYGLAALAKEKEAQGG